MLARVLLHVSEASVPVYAPAHGTRPLSQRSIQHVRDTLAFIGHIDDATIAQRSGVEKLTSGRRIKRGAIQVDAPSVLGHALDVGLKLGAIGVGIIDSVRHSRS